MVLKLRMMMEAPHQVEYNKLHLCQNVVEVEQRYRLVAMVKVDFIKAKKSGLDVQYGVWTSSP
jgi:hypothetical protein